MSFKIVKVRIQRSGELKMKPEQFLVDAITPTEAETKFHKHISQYGFSDLNVDAVTPQKVYHVLQENDEMEVEKWFKASVVLTTKSERKIPRKKGGGFRVVEKNQTVFIFIKDQDTKPARDAVEKYVKESIKVDAYNIKGIVETNITDLIR